MNDNSNNNLLINSQYPLPTGNTLLTKEENRSIKSDWINVKNIYANDNRYLIKIILERNVDNSNLNKGLFIRKCLDKFSSSDMLSIDTADQLIELYNNTIIPKAVPLAPFSSPMPSTSNGNKPEFVQIESNSNFTNFIEKNEGFFYIESEGDTQDNPSDFFEHDVSRKSLFKDGLFYCGVLILLGGISMFVGSANQKWKFKMGVENINALFVTIGFSVVGITMLCLVGYFMYTHHCCCPCDEREMLRI